MTRPVAVKPGIPASTSAFWFAFTMLIRMTEMISFIQASFAAASVGSLSCMPVLMV